MSERLARAAQCEGAMLSCLKRVHDQDAEIADRALTRASQWAMVIMALAIRQNSTGGDRWVIF